MDIQELIGNARDTMTVRRVFGDPYEKDGMTLIPAAAVRGGIGGGTFAPTGEVGRTGGGIGMEARPVGIYMLKDGMLRWRPAVDVHRTLRVATIGISILGFVMVRLFGRRRSIVAFRRHAPRRTVRAFLAR